jgi:fused signal recognition particle receptor
MTMSVRFNRWKEGLSLSSKAALGRIASLLGASGITAATWEELEILLIKADLGSETVASILTDLREVVKTKGLVQMDQLQAALKTELRKRLDIPQGLDLSATPTVILVVGVNGSGKTTSLAKLAYLMRGLGKKVFMIGADTFRAAAADQLGEWANRFELPVFLGQPGSDPGSVVYDGIRSAITKGTEVILIDTAGRLNTRVNLMDELKKIHKVAGKACPGAPHAVWLVLDATTGQNALSQASAFSAAVGVNGVILAKLDSSSKGGMVFSIRQQLGIPVLFAGLGEKIEDMATFNPDEFVEGILAA